MEGERGPRRPPQGEGKRNSPSRLRVPAGRSWSSLPGSTSKARKLALASQLLHLRGTQEEAFVRAPAYMLPDGGSKPPEDIPGLWPRGGSQVNLLARCEKEPALRQALCSCGPSEVEGPFDGFGEGDGQIPNGISGRYPFFFNNDGYGEHNIYFSDLC